MHIFAQINATVPDAPKHALKCHELLRHSVSSVVDKNVQLLRKVFPELLPKRRVPLIANYDANSVLFKLLAFGVNVYSYVTGIGQKEMKN